MMFVYEHFLQSNKQFPKPRALAGCASILAAIKLAMVSRNTSAYVSIIAAVAEARRIVGRIEFSNRRRKVTITGLTVWIALPLLN
jgi:hypothetical protein